MLRQNRDFFLHEITRALILPTDNDIEELIDSFIVLDGGPFDRVVRRRLVRDSLHFAILLFKTNRKESDQSSEMASMSSQWDSI